MNNKSLCTNANHSPYASHEVVSCDWTNLSIYVFVSSLSTFLTGISVLLGTNLWPFSITAALLRAFLVCQFLFAAPFLLAFFFRKKGCSGPFLNDFFFILLGVGIVIGIGYFAPVPAWSYTVMLVGGISFLGLHALALRQSAKEYLKVLLISVLFSGIVSGFAWTSADRNLLPSESIILGHGGGDTVYHVAIANMIKTYGIPSTGIDGIPYHFYHNGSHFIFAQISKVCQIDILIFYHVVFFIMWVPLLFQNLFLLTKKFRLLFGVKIIGMFCWEYLFLLLFFFLGFLPQPVAMAMGMPPMLGNESFVVSLTFIFVLIGQWLELHPTSLIAKAHTMSRLFLWLWAPLFLGVIIWIKISFYYVWAVIYAYLLLRYRKVRNWDWLVSAFLCLTLGLAIMPYISTVEAKSTFPYPFHLLIHSVGLGLQGYFFIFHFFWSWFFIFLRLRMEKLKSRSDLFMAIRANRLLDVELLVLLCIFSLIPGVTVFICGGGGYYFTEYQKWLALVFLGSRIDLIKKWSRHLRGQD